MVIAYVGSRTAVEENARGAGITVCRIDSSTGVWSVLQVVGDLVNPSFLCTSADGRFLYAVHGAQSEVSAFRIEPGSGHLDRINRQSTEGRNPVHLEIDPSGRFLVVANYATSSLVVLPIAEDGSLGTVSQKVELKAPPGPHPSEQTRPHPHHVRFDPEGAFVYAPDKGADRVWVFGFDSANGKLISAKEPFVSSRPGSGPRHIAFHPSLPRAYTVNELDSTLNVYERAPGGALRPLSTLSSLPPGPHAPNTGAEIAVAPSGRFLYASNRGHDTIATVAIDADGNPGSASWTSTAGSGPRFFTLDAGGTSLFAANQLSDTIVGFRVDPVSGQLASIGQVLATGSPVCIAFEDLRD